ncbi:MAG: flagellar biosynthesis protein FlhF [Sulfurospirillum sp.]|nr:MAG: flagellar biosynthesis protein FlhF [Sulfurospirillum sp.]
MKLYTFMGNSPAEALKKAQEVCGKDALVVSTKQLKKRSITSPALHEVVVALENRDKDQTTKHNSLDEYQPKKSSSQNSKIDKNVILEISSQAKELSKKVPQNTPYQFNEDFKKDKLNESKLQEQIKILNEKLDSIASMVWEERRKDRDNLIIPPEFATIYASAKNSGMAKEHIEELMKATIKEMPTYMKRSPSSIERYFQVLLKKMIPIRDESIFLNRQKRRVMLVGPTGVGKTTTLAKLAARYSFLEYDLQVGIITLDSYRIGAVEQLYTYAKMMKIPIESALDGSDFKKALQRLDYCDIILIDTIGSSQYDKAKIDKTYSLVKESPIKIDLNLVISAPTKLNDLKEIYKNYSILEPNSLIVTKFDESRDFGNIFSLTLESNLALSYFTTGQEVPDDLQIANAEFLTNSILKGYKHKESS